MPSIRSSTTMGEIMEWLKLSKITYIQFLYQLELRQRATNQALKSKF